MPFVHHHAPGKKPGSTDLCLVIQADRLLARPETTNTVVLPRYGDLGPWVKVAATPVHVGLAEDQSYWLCLLDAAEVSLPSGWQWHETRSLLGVLTPTQSQAISCARQLAYWDSRHRYCGVCGTPTTLLQEERARRCPKCAATFFPSASPAMIVAVTRGDELLLAHNRNFRAGMFSLLAGFVDPGETLEQAVAREVKEEVGLAVQNLRYVASQPWPFPNSLMLGFRAEYAGGEIQVDGKEIEQAGWYRRDALPDIPRPGTVARSLIDAWRQE